MLDAGDYYVAPLRWVNTGNNLTGFCNLINGTGTVWYQVGVASGATIIDAGTFPGSSGTLTLEDISSHAGKIRVANNGTTVTLSVGSLGTSYQYLCGFIVKA